MDVTVDESSRIECDSSVPTYENEASEASTELSSRRKIELGTLTSSVRYDDCSLEEYGELESRSVPRSE